MKLHTTQTVNRNPDTMLYELFSYLKNTDLPGKDLGNFLSFRAGAAIILSLLITIFFGKYVIRMLRRKQIGEDIRDLGLEGQLQKKGTPTMGGIIIIMAVLIPVLLFSDLSNVYIQLMLITTVWLGFIGGLDDYIKVFRHKKEGLNGRFKVFGQVGLGIIVGTTMWISSDIVIQEKEWTTTKYEVVDENGDTQVITEKVVVEKGEKKATETSIPFLKDTTLDYKNLIGGNETIGWLFYILVAIFIITAVSNGANLTDGIDGLLTGVSIPIVMVLGVLAYLSGHIIYSDYLNIMYIPYSAELIVFATAFVGALVGFLWYNSFPAQIFMGDTGSLTIGGIIAVFALCIRKELLLPLLCGVFLVEALSVIIQTTYFKYTKRKYGEGRRVFLMSPIHHHYQKKGLFETKIMMRFFIISLLLSALTLVTLKIQ